MSPSLASIPRRARESAGVSLLSLYFTFSSPYSVPYPYLKPLSSPFLHRRERTTEHKPHAQQRDQGDPPPTPGVLGVAC